MKAVLQRVSGASVAVGGEITGSIGRGYLVLLGVGEKDTKEHADKLAEKIRALRIFPDDNGKTNLSIEDVCGEMLIVSQFTLYADCRKGNRPSFAGAGSPALAEELYNYFIKICREKLAPDKISCGVSAR
jgi:D-tyrosyl-tRNA(Tyr) deacylase